MGWSRLPDDVRSASTLAHPDYADMCSMPTTVEADAERWARSMLGDTPDRAERFIWQRLLGLHLHPRPSPEYVAGWRIGRREPERVRLETGSPSFNCNMVILAGDGQIRLATLVRYIRPWRTRIWPPLSAVHRRLSPGLLRDAEQRLSAEPGATS